MSWLFFHLQEEKGGGEGEGAEGVREEDSKTLINDQK